MTEKILAFVGLLTVGYFAMRLGLCLGEFLWEKILNEKDEEVPYHMRHPN